MLRHLVERGGQTQQLLGGDLAIGLDRDETRAAAGQRAGLVEQQHLAAGEGLERAAALDQDAVAGGPRDAGDDRDRRRQDQRAGRRHHEHGKGAHRIARGQPRGAGDRERQRHEQERIAIGQPDERRLLGLRRLDQPHDAGVGALFGGRARPQVERIASIDGAAARPLAGLARDRQRLPGQRRFVEHRGAAHDHAVDRHRLAGPHQQAIAGPDRGERHLDDRAVAIAVGARRRSGEQPVQLPAGALLCVVLERAAARDHQRDHHARQHLAERHGAGHRQDRNQVDAELALDQLAHHGRQHHDQHRQGGAGPHPVGPAWRTREPGQSPADQAGCRQPEQCCIGPSGRLHAVSIERSSALHRPEPARAPWLVASSPPRRAREEACEPPRQRR